MHRTNAKWEAESICLQLSFLKLLTGFTLNLHCWGLQ